MNRNEPIEDTDDLPTEPPGAPIQAVAQEAPQAAAPQAAAPEAARAEVAPDVADPPTASGDVVYEALWVRWWSTRDGAAGIRSELDKPSAGGTVADVVGALQAMPSRTWQSLLPRAFPGIAEDDPAMSSAVVAAARVAERVPALDDLYRRRLAGLLAKAAAHGGPAAAIRAAQDGWVTAPGTYAEQALAPLRAVADVLAGAGAPIGDDVAALEAAIPVCLREVALAEADPKRAAEVVEEAASEIGWCVESELLSLLYSRAG